MLFPHSFPLELFSLQDALDWNRGDLDLSCHFCIVLDVHRVDALRHGTNTNAHT